jgi:hypothetical protein
MGHRDALLCDTTYRNATAARSAPRESVRRGFVQASSRHVRGVPGTLRFRYRFRRPRTSDGLCVVHLPVPRVTSRLSDGRGSANKVEFLLSKPVQIVFG